MYTVYTGTLHCCRSIAQRRGAHLTLNSSQNPSSKIDCYFSTIPPHTHKLDNNRQCSSGGVMCHQAASWLIISPDSVMLLKTHMIFKNIYFHNSYTPTTISVFFLIFSLYLDSYVRSVSDICTFERRRRYALRVTTRGDWSSDKMMTKCSLALDLITRVFAASDSDSWMRSSRWCYQELISLLFPPRHPRLVTSEYTPTFRAADTAGWTSAAGVRSSFVLSILNTLAAGLHRQASSQAPGHKWLLPDQTKTRLSFTLCWQRLMTRAGKTCIRITH